jgi:hypothetical protein
MKTEGRPLTSFTRMTVPLLAGLGRPFRCAIGQYWQRRERKSNRKSDFY